MSNDDEYDDGGIDWSAVDIAMPDSMPTSHTSSNNRQEPTFTSLISQQQGQQEGHQYHQIITNPSSTRSYTPMQINAPLVQPVQNVNMAYSHNNFNSFEASQCQPQSQSECQPLSQSECQLKEQIKKMQALLSQKDEKLFDLESSLASIEAEANYKVQKAQQDVTNQMKSANDALRKLENEVDSKSLIIAKLKKRKLDVTNQLLAASKSMALPSNNTGTGTNNVNENQIYMNTSSATDSTSTRAMEQVEYNQPQNEIIHRNENQTFLHPHHRDQQKNNTRFKNRTPPLQKEIRCNNHTTNTITNTTNTATQTVTSIRNPHHNTTSTPIDSPLNTDTGNHRNSKHALSCQKQKQKQKQKQQQRYHLSVITNKYTNAELATYLMQHYNGVIISSTSSSPSPSSSSADNNSLEDISKSQSIYIYSNRNNVNDKKTNSTLSSPSPSSWNDLLLDQYKIHNLLHLLATPESNQNTCSNYTTRTNNTITTKTNTTFGHPSRNSIKKQNQCINISYITKEILHILVHRVKQGKMKLQHNDVRRRQRRHGKSSKHNRTMCHSNTTGTNEQRQQTQTQEQTQKQRNEQYSSLHLNDWKSASDSLSLLHELCTVSAEARFYIRKWICDYHHHRHPRKDNSNGKATTSSKNHNNNNNHRTSNIATSSPFHTSARIRGLSKKQMQQFNHHVAQQFKNVSMPCNENDENNNDNDNDSYEEQDRIQYEGICSDFFQILYYFIMLGSSTRTRASIGTIINLQKEGDDLIKLLSIQSVKFLLVLICDVPKHTRLHHHNDEKDNMSIWSILFNYCFLQMDVDVIMSNSSSEHENDKRCGCNVMTALLLGNDHVIGRQSYLLQKNIIPTSKENNQQLSSKSASTIIENNSVSSNNNKFQHLSLRLLMMQLLDQILSSSIYIRCISLRESANLVLCTNPAYREDVTLERLIIANILDKLQILILPLLKNHHNINKSITLENIDHIASLSLCMIHVIVLLSETATGINLLRSQMKVGPYDTNSNDSNEDAASGVTLLVDLLEYSIRLLMHHNESFVNINCWRNISHNVINFFTLLFRHVIENEKSKGSNNLETRAQESLLLILFDTERLRSFKLSCKVIVQSGHNKIGFDTFGEMTIIRAKLLLKEIEEGMQSE